MDWKEIEIKTTHQAYPAIANLLEELQVAGISKEECAAEEDELVIKAYLNVDSEKLEAAIDQLQEDIFSLQQYNLEVGSGKIKVNQVQKEDWANQWKENFHPIRLTDKIVIKPTWEAYPANPEEIVIEIDPGQAFGTGYHATTENSLQLIEDYLQPGMSFLDVGSGTGILSIAAAKLGAGTVTGVDIDPQAVEVARENAQLNQVAEKIDFKQGDLVNQVNAKYQLVAANILPHIILDLIPDLDEVVAGEGTFILSGIIDEKEEKIKNKLQSYNFELETTIHNGEWVTIAGSRSE